ncbi:hypothetical protein MBLNU230_g3578t1 [Neophaeotheca triangularis]
MSSAGQSDAFTFLPQGGIIQEFRVGGTNIVLGFPSAETYKKLGDKTQFFGENIGRVANRISNAKVEVNGKTHSLAANDGPNSLHGGAKGWGKKIWDGPHPVNRNGKEAVLFKYLSKDGEEGFPGTVELRTWYIASREQQDGVEKTTLEIEYEAELVGDDAEETAIGVTNHSYFNISGGPTIEGTQATLHTVLHQVTDDADIPTGEIKPFPGIEANKEFTFGPKEPAIDHCMIVNPDPKSVPVDTRKQPLNKLITMYHPNSKIHFEALSTEPAFQCYTGAGIGVPATDETPAFGPRSGMCIEASRYVNAINTPEYRDMVILKKGQTFGSRTIYRAWKD